MPFMLVRTGIAALCAWAVGLALASVVAAGAEDALTPAELARLDAGGRVERRVKERRGDLHLMGGSAWQVIDAPPDVVWAALLDTPHYTRFLPQVDEARVVAEHDHERTVFIRHRGWLAPSYYLTLEINRARGYIGFHLDPSRPHDIRAAWGFYSVRGYADGRTLVAYSVRADIGRGLVSALLRASVHEWMLKVPWLLKRFVEGSGRYLYAPVAEAARERALARGPQ